MRLPRVRFTVRRMMAAVAIVSLVAAIAIEVPPTIEPLMLDRGVRLGPVAYGLAVVSLTGAVAIPLVAAACLSCGVVSRTRGRRRLPIRRSLAAAALLALGLAALLGPLPLDGLRQAHRLDGGKFVAFYHRYRLRPGAHVTPCLELLARDGGRRTYPLGLGAAVRNARIRTDPARTMVWVVDLPGPTTRSRGVLCSLDLTTGEFIDTPGPFPAGVSQSSGVPAP